MRINKFLTICTAALCIGCIVSCNKDDDKKDTEKPAFDNTNSTPKDGDKFAPGDTIYFHQSFTDNEELGSFNIEIHNNFDHHSHSTESISKHGDHEHGEAEDAWVFNQDYEIPSGKKNYTADFKILIPKTTADGDPIAEGDYHFMIRVTDKAGWQEIKAVEIEVED